MNKLLFVVCILITNATFISSRTCLALAVHNPSSPTLKCSGPHQHSSCHHYATNGILSSLRGGSTRFPFPLATKSPNNNSKDPETSQSQLEKVLVVPPQPTPYQLVRFYLPCLGLWLSGPLLSLVDTAFVGLTAAPGKGAAELGALGPATTFIDGSTYLFAFLNAATTNLYANALAKNKNQVDKSKIVDDRRAGNAVIRTATKISLICGFFLLGLLLTSSRALLKIYIGDETALATILDPAAAYVNIRAWSMPTTLLSNVIQAALLGAQDSITPLVAVAYSTVVNVIGDWYCVVPRRMGGRGAAIATVIAQIAGTLAMVRPARQKLFAPSSSADVTDNIQDRVSSRSFLAFAAPVLTLILGKISAFGIMTWVAAALPGGVVSLAAHQITLSLFFFMSPFLEVLSQTAQAFMPQYLTLYESDGVTVSSEGKQEADKLALRLLRYGVLVACIVASVASIIPRFFPFFLTNDLTVQTAVRPLAAPLLIAALLTAPVAVSEGVLLARRELKYLASVYLVSTAIFPFALSTIKKTAGPVVHVWIGFAMFQLFRAICFTGRIWGPNIIQYFNMGSRKRALPTV